MPSNKTVLRKHPFKLAPWLCVLWIAVVSAQPAVNNGAGLSEFNSTYTASRTTTWPQVLQQAAGLPRLYSLLVSRDGELIQEHYFNGKRADDIANIKSASKSIMSALVGIAIDKGFVQGTSQSINDFFREEISNNNLNITVGNLLSMQAGLETTSNRNYGRWVLSDNWIEFALKQPPYDRPGGRMIYSTGNTHLLSAIVTRASQLNTLSFARRFLFGPMNTHLSSWPRDPQGLYFGGNDMELTPRQMLAFGELYINGGKYNNQQIIPADWVQRSTTARVASPRGQGRHYGYGWWIRDTAGYETPYAWGYGGQFILLVPEEKIVVVVTSNSNPGDDRRFHTRAAYRLVESAVQAALPTKK